jgi:excisionase family DNA binding protein
MNTEALARKRVADGARLLTVGEAAFALNIGKRSVWRLIASGELPSIRLGRSVRVPVEGIDRLIQRGGTR